MVSSLSSDLFHFKCHRICFIQFVRRLVKYLLNEEKLSSSMGRIVATHIAHLNIHR